ncbi:flagellar hook protein [Novosphingobium fuchskuhlense]|uniref:Flagellar hook-associated protein 1 n=1 Tax=Novosphingobium fuchskuhlense TaxID=1117702 RepID=A0A117UXM2_9SPHN|nr:flagellar hook-associated protein FlgK [Novosphingobium fuchskuhlense]KUR72729.1 flagellar hook protein [Novosphingobium fuchskuhlense]
MASDLLSIGLSGAKAARIGLDVTAQNISNAATEGYVRRSVGLTEVASTGYNQNTRDVSLSGVRVDMIVRNADAFRQSEVRRTGADTARANAEVTGLGNIEAALEQSGIYTAITGFDASLQKLKEDPVDTSLRASVIESARTMGATFQIAAKEMDAVGKGLRFEAADGVTQVNRIAGELARTNLRLARAADASSDQTALLDQRDKLLADLSQYGDIATTMAQDGSVTVTLGTSAAGTPLVSGGDTKALAMTTAGDGTVSYTLDSGALTLAGGSLAGQQLALGKLAQLGTDLDTLAGSIVTTVNTAQAAGTDRNGNPGADLLTGSTAETIALATGDPAKIVTAPANAPKNSRDPAGLEALRGALATADPAGKMDAILFDVSATVSGRTVTRDALATISGAAKTALSAQTGVDLDTEGVNLVRYQQAFQASGRVMQVAASLFDSLLQIR